MSLPKCAEHREASAGAQPAPQTFVLLPHLSEDPELQTGPSRCTLNSRLFITHCHRILPNPPPPPSARSDINQQQRGRPWLRLPAPGSGSGSGSITALPNNAATLLPSHHTPAKMAGEGGGGLSHTGRSRQTRGRVISV